MRLKRRGVGFTQPLSRQYLGLSEADVGSTLAPKAMDGSYG